MSDTDQNPAKNLGLFSLLETSTQVKFFLLTTTFIFWLDTWFLHLNKPGVIELASNPALYNINLSVTIILFFVLFSLFASLIFPFAALIPNALYAGIFSTFIKKLISFLKAKPDFKKSDDYVSLFKIRETAHKNKDKFLLDIYEERMKIISESNSATTKLGLFSLYCLTMLWVNFMLDKQGKAISTVVLNYSGHPTALLWALTFGLLILAFFRYHQENDYTAYCPSLKEDKEPAYIKAQKDAMNSFGENNKFRSRSVPIKVAPPSTPTIRKSAPTKTKIQPPSVIPEEEEQN